MNAISKVNRETSHYESGVKNMAKAVFQDGKFLQLAKRMACGVIGYRKMRDGRVIAVKWPSRKK